MRSLGLRSAFTLASLALVGSGCGQDDVADLPPRPDLSASRDQAGFDAASADRATPPDDGAGGPDTAVTRDASSPPDAAIADDAAAPDFGLPDALLPDSAAGPDLQVPDLVALPDSVSIQRDFSARPDQLVAPTPDSAAPPDLAQPDLAQPDLAQPDLALPPPLPSVTTNRYDNGRTGASLAETTLAVATVAGGDFGYLFSRPVVGQIYAQPLYLPALTVNGAPHNVVFVATAHNNVYAFDADDPFALAPLWTASLGPSAPIGPGTALGTCGDMQPEVGTTSTPAIDPKRGAIYLVAKTLENGVYFQRLHALDLVTGKELPGSPVAISGQVVGTGAGAVNGMVPFLPRQQLNRAGLLVQGGVVYAAFSSHCDDDPYHGWVFAYDGGSLAQLGLYNNTANGTRGGIWQSGMGLSGDAGGVYFAGGNGDFDHTGNGAMLGLSVTRLALAGGKLAPADFWIPSNGDALNNADLDFTTGVVLVPGGSKLALVGGKDGILRTLDRTRLGGFHPQDQIVGATAFGGAHHGSPVYWDSPDGPRVYSWVVGGQLTVHRFGPAGLGAMPLSTAAVVAGFHPGGIVTVSASGSAPGSGVAWATIADRDSWHGTSPGTLFAYDAMDLTRELWRSDDYTSRDAVGGFGKFNPPTVVNGKLYLGTFSNVLRVYGPHPIPKNRLDFLSDHVWTAASSGWGPIEKDMSNGEQAPADGHTITIAGVKYDKGLGMHALADVRYTLGAAYRQFVSDVGIDDEEAGAGSVVFQVWLDGVKAYDSGVVRGYEPVRSIALDVSGVNELRLVVTDAGDGIGNDHADWAAPRLIK